MLKSPLDIDPVSGQVLQILCLNARSIKNKLEEIEAVICQIRNVDVIVITECWIQQRFIDELLNKYKKINTRVVRKVRSPTTLRLNEQR